MKEVYKVSCVKNWYAHKLLQDQYLFEILHTSSSVTFGDGGHRFFVGMKEGTVIPYKTGTKKRSLKPTILDFHKIWPICVHQ